MARKTAGLVLAAGSGQRFGGGKLLARVGGRPILQHVLEALATAGLSEVIVVLGDEAQAIEDAIEWRTERRILNEQPANGLSSSLRIGMGAIEPDFDSVVIALGDQPLISVEVIRTLLRASAGERAIVVPVHAGHQGRNPVRIDRGAFGLVAETQGDRGFGPILAAHPTSVLEISVPGDNPDVDTPDDLCRVAEAAWAARVRANRDQVERIREVPDGADFYAPVSSLFRADPTRTGDAVLDALRDLIRSGETWLDIGAGAGRYALPLAIALDPSGGLVVALDASRSMLEGLREIADDHAIENIRTIEGRWPPGDGRSLGALDADIDVALIAHVGYDIEAIGPFLDAMETAAGRQCVALMMERMPAAAADPFWPLVHDEGRIALPALPDLLDLLVARGREPTVTRVAAEGRRFESREAIEAFALRQLWIDPAGAKGERLRSALEDLAVEDERGWSIVGHVQSDVGIVTWSVR